MASFQKKCTILIKPMQFAIRLSLLWTIYVLVKSSISIPRIIHTNAVPQVKNMSDTFLTYTTSLSIYKISKRSIEHLPVSNYKVCRQEDCTCVRKSTYVCWTTNWWYCNQYLLEARSAAAKWIKCKKLRRDLPFRTNISKSKKV